MKILKRRDKRNEQEKEEDRILQQMSITDPSSEEYARMAEIYATIVDANKKKEDRKEKIHPDTVILAMTSLLGVFGCLHFESIGGFINTKALQFVQKIRVK